MLGADGWRAPAGDRLEASYGLTELLDDIQIFGAELKEYDRVSLLPGTCRLTYCPGRNAIG